MIPLAIASCELTQIETDPNLATQIFLRSDNAAQACPGSYPADSAGSTTATGTARSTSTSMGSSLGTTGNNPDKTGCTVADFKALLGETILVPIYGAFTAEAGGKANESGGSHGKFKISSSRPSR